MNIILRTLLLEWQDRVLPQILPREDFLDITANPKVNNATVITGFRRVGKTYLMFEAIERLLKTNSREDVIYINFEDERVVNPDVEILTDLIPEIESLYGKKPKYLFLDELQLIPNWSKWVRRILDSENIQIFITGPSSKMSSSELPTELRGRAWEKTVHPLNFKEFLKFKNEKIDLEKIGLVKREKSKFNYLFNEYLVFGGLPAVVLTIPEKKQELLQSYYQAVVQREIIERNNIDNEVVLKSLLNLILNSTYITISKLFNILKSLGMAVGKSTVDLYISYTKSSYFMDELYIYNSSLVNRLQHSRKVYFVDTGFITALSTKFSKNIGRLFENAVYQNLVRDTKSIYYYKDRNGYEVDFVEIKSEKVDALYQVCYDLTEKETLDREVRALINAGKNLNCKKLNLITNNFTTKLKLPNNIKLVSSQEFLLL